MHIFKKIFGKLQTNDLKEKKTDYGKNIACEMYRTDSISDFRRHFLTNGYHFKLLCDQKRVSGFQKAIDELIKEDDVVADLGAGIGILSFMAAEKAKKVYSVELDSLTYEIGSNLVKKSAFHDKISFILGNALNITLPEKVDVVMCEMIDTGCISDVEPQVLVMNHANKNLLRNNGVVIPRFIETEGLLINTDYNIIKGVDFKNIYLADTHTLKRQVLLSDPKIFQKIDFSKTNNLEFKERFQIQTNRDGILNGLMIQSTLYFTEKFSIKCDFEQLWPPLVFPLEDVKIEKGQIIDVEIYYTLGGGLKNLNLNVFVK